MNRVIVLTLIVLSLVSCDDEQERQVDYELEQKSYNISKDYTIGHVKAKGDRLFGIMYAPELGDDASDWELVKDIGVNAQLMGFSWSQIESEPGKFDFEVIDQQNILYKDMKIILMLNPIETDYLAVPSDLEGIEFDNPQMISRFKTFIDNVFAHMPDLDVHTLLIGNEVNGYLVDYDKWDEYKTFYDAVGAHARTLRPGMKIGTEFMNEGIVDDYPDKVKELISSGDVIAYNFYPTDPNPKYFANPSVDIMDEQISDIVRLYGHKKIHIIETGYSSSPTLGSSEAEAAEFIRKLFQLWDQHPQLEYVGFPTLDDAEQEYINELYTALGVSEHPNYKEILEAITTQGLRTHNGTDKLAFVVLKREAEARGW